MPIYEYRCEACGHYLETLQKISDPPLTDCHKCGQPTLKKLISASAFRLKGSGWYETDFKTGNKKNVVQADKAGSSGSQSGSKPGSTASTKKSTSS